MRFVSAAVSDVGNVKKTNQDSLIVKITDFKNYGQVAMAIICDGMGGYSKGELASATVINSFEQWFECKLPDMLNELTPSVIAEQWTQLLVENNSMIRDYCLSRGLKMGTTFSGVILFKNHFQAVHVGDSRVYLKRDRLKQLTEDHSFVAREVKLGNMTEEEARVDSRRNILTQCIGLSKKIEPHIVSGSLGGGEVFMLCSDGLYHSFSESQLDFIVSGDNIKNVGIMKKCCQNTIDKAKKSGENDNISMILFKCTDKADRVIDETEVVQNIKMINTEELL